MSPAPHPRSSPLQTLPSRKAGAASGRAPGAGTGTGLGEDTERSRCPQNTLGPKGRCHLQAADGATPLCETRARRAGRGPGRRGSQCRQGAAPGRAQRQRDRLRGERRKSPEPQWRDRDGTHTSCTPGTPQSPRPAGGEAAPGGQPGIHAVSKCKGSWHDLRSVYRCRWGEGSRFLSPCGFPTLKAAWAIRGGGKGKEKRISQFRHSSDLPCHCTTRCSVCRTLRARGHANDTGMKEPWQE